MAVLVDLICSKCESIYQDMWSTDEGQPHVECGGKMERLWTLTPAPQPMPHHSERCVVYVSQKEGGKIQYPGRSDTPIPDRLKRRGYERVEMNPSQLGAFERKHGVVNERRNYDKGSGRSYDGS